MPSCDFFYLMPSRVKVHFSSVNLKVYTLHIDIIHVYKKINTKYIYAVNKKGVSCRKEVVSWTKIAFLFKRS